MKAHFLNVCMALIAVSLIFSSCSVQKRRYRPGFHFETNTKPVAEPKEHKVPVENKEVTASVDQPVEQAAAPAEDITASATVEIPVTTEKQVVETPKAVKKAHKTPVPVKLLGSKDFKYEKKHDKNAYKAGPMGILGDDKLIAILLCIFLGWIGIHRFYLGYVISGIVYIALFIAAVVLGGWVLGFVGWICGLVLFILIILDLIFLIVDKPLFFQQ